MPERVRDFGKEQAQNQSYDNRTQVTIEKDLSADSVQALWQTTWALQKHVHLDKEQEALRETFR